jgi:hypothetical protein
VPPKSAYIPFPLPFIANRLLLLLLLFIRRLSPFSFSPYQLSLPPPSSPPAGGGQIVSVLLIVNIPPPLHLSPVIPLLPSFPAFIASPHLCLHFVVQPNGRTSIPHAHAHPHLSAHQC